MVGLRFPLSPCGSCWVYGSGFRVNAAKFLSLPFSLLSFIGRFRSVGSGFGVLAEVSLSPTPVVRGVFKVNRQGLGWEGGGYHWGGGRLRGTQAPLAEAPA